MRWRYSWEQPPHNEHVSTQQGILHKEPTEKEFARIKKLFCFTGDILDIHDTRFTPLEPRVLEIEYTIEADNKSALKLEPNVQMKFPGFE